MVVTLISLITSEAEHLFIHLLAIYVSSVGNILCQSERAPLFDGCGKS